MKKSAIFLLILFVSAAAFGFSSAPNTNKAMDFTLKDLSGNSIPLNSYKGKVVLLAFFDTDCPACQDEIPQLEPIYQKYKGKNFDVLAINLRENADVVRLFAGKNKISFPVLLDEKGSVGAAYKIRFIPRIFILDRAGEIKFRSYYLPAEDIESEVKKALQ